MDRTPLYFATTQARRLLVGAEALDPDVALTHLLRQVAIKMMAARSMDPTACPLLPDPGGPPPPGLAALLDAPALSPVWAEAETLGWVYQYFREAERDEVWRRLYQQERQKIGAPDLPAATQLYTPRWIVRWLLANTLGRHWLQMHPDSRLAQRLPYLVPLAGDIPPVPLKPVKAITLLDPACGTMHFGLAAFDLLVAMYREERERAGSPGWPAVPSVAAEAEIPGAIITHNLHGLDIDPLAIRLAKLSLHLKAGLAAPIPTNLRWTGADPAGSLARVEGEGARYDVVVTNPPYLYYANMDDRLAAYLAEQYPDARWDLYAAFIQRGLELVADGGRLGLITQQSFMFISSYERLRAQILGQTAIEAAGHLGTRAFAEIVGEKVNTVMFAIRADADAPRRSAAVGTYLRLLPGEGPEKQAACLAALDRLRGRDGTEPGPQVYRRPQADFARLPGSPLVYWLEEPAFRLFEGHSAFAERGRFCRGLTTAANARFVRYWWEVGRERVAFGCAGHAEAGRTGKRWFPYMKGGSPRRWFGHAEHVVNWEGEGAELKAFPGSAIRNLDWQFRPGATYSSVSGSGFTGRYMPPGFLFDQASNALFPRAGAEELELLLALLNHPVTDFVMLLNPTVNVVESDIRRIPWPVPSDGNRERLAALWGKVRRAIALAGEIYNTEETSPWFSAPLLREGERADLARTEGEIRALVDELLGIAGVDLLEGLASPGPGALPAPSAAEQAWRWLSYAVGIVAGRFRPGVPGLGSAVDAGGEPLFPASVAGELRGLAGSGIMVLEPGHADDLPPRVERALQLMLGPEGAARTVAAAGGDPQRMERSLRRLLERHFFTGFHLRQYARRPIYWLLQSRGKRWGVYLYHERITSETLRLLRGPAYLGGAIRRAGEAGDSGLATELEAFSEAIRAADEAGWASEPDDGVLLNLAPLHALVPAWSAELRKAWAALRAGEYGWSRTGERYQS